MNNIRLLIIEEHMAVRHALQVRLQSSSNIDVIAAFPSVDDWMGHQQQGLSNGFWAVDVVLLGLRGSNGRQLSSTIDDIKKFEQLGMDVVVLTPYADDVEREFLLQAGAQRYLLKDINSIQLLAEIEAIATARSG